MRVLTVASLALSAVFLITAVARPRADEPPKSDKELRSNSKTLQQWVRDFQDRDPTHRETAYRAVALSGRDGRDALPGLINAIKNESDPGLRVHASIAIGMIGLDEKNLKSGVDALRRLLNDTQGSVCFQAATALGRIGPGANAALPNLVTLVRHQSWEVRKAAAFALGTLGVDPMNGPDMKAINALLNALKDPSSQVRLEAVTAVVKLGPPVSNPVSNPDAKKPVVQA